MQEVIEADNASKKSKKPQNLDKYSASLIEMVQTMLFAVSTFDQVVDFLEASTYDSIPTDSSVSTFKKGKRRSRSRSNNKGQ
jgi:hypothetical protein